MRRAILILVILFVLAIPVKATEISAPEPPPEAEAYLPEESASFGEDLWYIFKSATKELQPSLAEAASVCLGVIVTVILISILQNYSPSAKGVSEFAGTVALGLILFGPMNSLVELGTSTIRQVSEYGKLLLPVMTTAMAAQGGTTTAAALYTGTAFFDSLLSSAITQVLIPMLYAYLCVCLAYSAIGEGVLNTLRQLLKWLITWGLKIILYVFTGYISITGVVSGTTDAAAMKAAKLTISGAVPVVGGILSDASEAVLVSAGVLKNSVGVYGFVAITAILIGPFLKIGAQYLILKVTGGICSSFPSGRLPEIVKDFTGAMGLLLAMTGTVSLLLLISLVCFMRGIG